MPKKFLAGYAIMFFIAAFVWVCFCVESCRETSGQIKETFFGDTSQAISTPTPEVTTPEEADAGLTGWIRETLPVSDYIVRSKNNSRIDPFQELEEEVGLRCPLCGIQGSVLQHGESRTCDCGLKMTVYGAALECAISEKGLELAFESTAGKIEPYKDPDMQDLSDGVRQLADGYLDLLANCYEKLIECNNAK